VSARTLDLALVLVSILCPAATVSARSVLVADSQRDALIRVDLDGGAQTVVRELDIRFDEQLVRAPGDVIYSSSRPSAGSSRSTSTASRSDRASRTSGWRSSTGPRRCRTEPWP